MIDFFLFFILFKSGRGDLNRGALHKGDQSKPIELQGYWLSEKCLYSIEK